MVERSEGEVEEEDADEEVEGDGVGVVLFEDGEVEGEEV